MWKLKVPKMSCGHCVRTVEEAVRSVDPTARVDVDLADKIVAVETSAPEQTISDVIQPAGYDNEKLAP
jgi:copper chaperone